MAKVTLKIAWKCQRWWTVTTTQLETQSRAAALYLPENKNTHLWPEREATQRKRPKPEPRFVAPLTSTPLQTKHRRTFGTHRQPQSFITKQRKCPHPRTNWNAHILNYALKLAFDRFCPHFNDLNQGQECEWITIVEGERQKGDEFGCSCDCVSALLQSWNVKDTIPLRIPVVSAPGHFLPFCLGFWWIQFRLLKSAQTNANAKC